MSDEEHWSAFKYHLEQIEMQVGSAERGRQRPGSLLGFVGEVEFQLERIKELAETWEDEIIDDSLNDDDDSIVGQDVVTLLENAMKKEGFTGRTPGVPRLKDDEE